MTILHLCRRFWPDQGGVETHVEKVCQELIKRGHQVQVITLSPENQKKSSLENRHNGISIFRIPINPESSKFQYKLVVWRWLFHNRSIWLKADAIQIHDVFWWMLPFILIVKNKAFMTFHGYEPPGPPTRAQRFWHQLAHRLTNGSIGIGNFHSKWYGVQPTIISFGAVDTTVWQKSGLSKPVSQSRKNMMYLGRLSDDVGIMSYLEGLKLALQSNKVYQNSAPSSKKVHLDVYGSGELLIAAKKMVEANNLPVTFKGQIPEASTFQSRYRLCFASRHLALIELLSQGATIIAHYNNEIKKDYLLDDTPFRKWIHTFQNPNELASLLLTETLKPPPPVAIAWARDQTWQKMVDQYERLWRRASDSVE